MSLPPTWLDRKIPAPSPKKSISERHQSALGGDEGRGTPDLGACYHAPKIGAMGKFRISIHEEEQDFLRKWLVSHRKEAGLTQRELAKRLGVVHSLVGKVENGERRLDVVELVTYCIGLNADPCRLVSLLKKKVRTSRQQPPLEDAVTVSAEKKQRIISKRART